MSSAPSVDLLDRPPHTQRAAAPWSSRIDWLLVFILFNIACQLMLLIPGVGPARVILRMAAFGGSIGLLGILTRRGERHPASHVALVVLALMALNLFHPDTQSLLAALAQIFLYAAILAPLFWVSGTLVSEAVFRRAILVFWGYYTLGALVGVIQVYAPGLIEPAVSTAIQARGEWYVQDLKITLANGMRVFRPMGLSDAPGAAATSGFYAVLFGFTLWMYERDWRVRLLTLASVPIGLFCIYLSQTRSVLVMALVCVVAMLGVLVLRGEVRRAVGMLGLMAALVAGSFIWAATVGGDAVTGRIESLISDDAGTVYYSNRGRFLEETIKDHLPQYPMGAGLGRWGMTNTYFADNQGKEPLWAEIQWTGWLFDGGLPLVAAYALAICLAAWVALNIALDRRTPRLGLLASLVCAYDVGTIAVTFNNPVFMGTTGLEFWLLNAALYSAYRHMLRAQYRPMRATSRGATA
jgi:hypothetical protein